MAEKKALKKIVTLELHTYAAFCRWLRDTKKTTVSRLVKENEETQERMLEEFLLLTSEESAE